MDAIYVRVSHGSQDTASQELDLKRWATTQDQPARWFKDKATGLKMERPGMAKLLAAVRSGEVKRVVVWRLDRLGRTARGLLEWFDELKQAGCGFVSLKDSIDLSTPSGRLLVTVLAGVAQFETEVRSERQRAGIDAAREKHGGRCPWGGRKAGTVVRATREKKAQVEKMDADNVPIAEISRVVELSRQTIYRILGRWERK